MDELKLRAASAGGQNWGLAVSRGCGWSVPVDPEVEDTRLIKGWMKKWPEQVAVQGNRLARVYLGGSTAPIAI